MSGSGDADPGPSGSSGSCWSFGPSSADTGLGLSAGRVLPGRIRCLSNPAPPGRLPSLRTRDMTLGGAYKKPKKTFEPNVHAVRKSKDELKGKIQTASKPQRTEREEKKREKREKRVRRRERPPTIQSHSIFEQGPADSSRRPGCRGVTDVRDSTSSSVCKLVKKESEEDEEEILNKLHRDDFIDDLDLENRSKLKPIQLPLCRSVAMKSPGLSRSSCVYGSVVCGPENPPPLRPQSTGGPGPAVCGRTEPRPPQPSLVDLLQELSLSGSEELFFMQLPDCMPFRTKKETHKEMHKERRTEDKRPGHEVVAKEACPVLSQFPEGFLGKLQIRRSGSVVLKVGEVVMDVSEGAAFSFLQQLVSVRLSDGQTGDMMVLGNVRHKLVLSPDFHTFLQQTAAQQQQQS
ncbi:DNA-directed RNA polymerase III subunit RPC4-like isoform X1 [Sphaeramia orbicularis]|uniref:DNA-directed RNA polymerase III subunit RPC4-like isoform X1 n=1 Tax=Sphaeramia orbicularis TaxID=375764 RepID=UPI00117F7B6D|nr:DNA-directed RNA polymerase III subunit RPC4-like isoform X1 [Sphaeramia orbicularis]XP_030019225.1 DNA-directed RNA polymerase III subunit RPC4-like isoform X1 [Sphaeramia orbicularis]XP_030019226.1 DNA-directed RNA polymerase III subunit RPC4-like isoform X1 [Sphaeramia orbicularis]